MGVPSGSLSPAARGLARKTSASTNGDGRAPHPLILIALRGRSGNPSPFVRGAGQRLAHEEHICGLRQRLTHIRFAGGTARADDPPHRAQPLGRVHSLRCLRKRPTHRLLLPRPTSNVKCYTWTGSWTELCVLCSIQAPATISPRQSERRNSSYGWISMPSSLVRCVVSSPIRIDLFGANSSLSALRLLRW